MRLSKSESQDTPTLILKAPWIKKKFAQNTIYLRQATQLKRKATHIRASQNAQKEEEAFETSSFGTDSNFSDKCKQDQKDRDDVELDTERQPDSMRELLPAYSQGRKIPRA